MFLGMEAVDAEGLDLYRERVGPDDDFRAPGAARRMGVMVAINLIVDPAWDEGRFRVVREFALSVPGIVHLTVTTPYPGTEIWRTRAVLDRKHLGLRNAVGTVGGLGRNPLRGRTDFARTPWKFGRVYEADRQMAGHRRPVRHELPAPERRAAPPGRQELFAHTRDATPAHRRPAPEADGVWGAARDGRGVRGRGATDRGMTGEVRRAGV